MAGAAPTITYPLKTTQLYSRAAMGYLWAKRSEFGKTTVEALEKIYNRRTKGTLQCQQEIEYAPTNRSKASRMGYGRIYSKGPGLEKLEYDCRATLCRDYYHDLDMVNAHPTILTQFVRRTLDMDMPVLENYLDNREAVLAAVSAADDCDRDSAKKQVLAILNGSTPKIDCLRPLAEEVRRVAKILSNMPEHVALFESLKSEKNHYGSFLSHLTQTEERKCMLAMRRWCLAHDLSPDILCYDGIMVRKKEGLVITDEMLADLAGGVLEDTGYRIQIKEKPLVGFPFEATADAAIGPDPHVSVADYAAMKADFESRAGFLAPAGKFYLLRDNVVEFYDKESAQTVFGPIWHFPVPGQFEPVWFFPLWLKDPTRKITSSITINPADAGPGVLVLPFSPAWKDEEPPEDADVRVAFFKGFLEALVPDAQMRDCLTEWLAQLIQQPFKNSLTCPVLAGIKGCGKDTLGDFIGQHLLGRNYATNYDSNEQFWNPYDTGRHNRLFAKLEEACGVMNRQNEAALKARITASEITFNPKNVKPFTDRNFCRLMLTTNEANPVKMDEHERRFLVIHCGGSKVGDMAYFTELRRLLFCPEGAAAVGAWLEGLTIGAFPRVLPRSALAEAMIEDGKSVEVLWLESGEVWEKPEGMTSSELFPVFKAWCCATGKEPTRSVVVFGRNMGQAALDGKVVRVNHHGRSLYRQPGGG